MEAKFFQGRKSAPANKRNIYLDLDVLFDTRLATLYGLDPNIAEYCVKNGYYHTRFRDNFSCISSDIFYSYYRSRDKLTLYYGIPTNMFRVVSEHYGDLLTDLKTIDHSDDLKIYVNIHPYDLEVEEIEAILQLLKDQILDVKLEVVKLGMRELTPRWMVNHIGTIFMYNACEWLEYHSANTNIYNDPIVNLYMFPPRIVMGSNRYNNETVKIDKKYFIDIEKNMNIITNFHYLDPIMYSAQRVPIAKEDIEEDDSDAKKEEGTE